MLCTLCSEDYEFLRESTMQYNFLASSAPATLFITLFAPLCKSEKLIRLLFIAELLTL